jgi:L-alanine-DL-glutamate epimerase-like enolase superfamily enzyme
MANLHATAALLPGVGPEEWNDPSTRTHPVFENPSRPIDGLFHLPDGPGLALSLRSAELESRRR